MQTKVIQQPDQSNVATQAHVIETRDLRKSYGSDEVLHGLSLSVPKHAIFGFLGPNGSGKTTTIKLLLGLSRPSGGTGQVFGADMIEDSLRIRERVGYLAQEPRFYTHMTARETLRFAARFFFDGPATAIEARVEETLDLVGLADRADRPVRGFSGGERQRLGIAQAQVNHPDLLILDEPAASLDPLGRRDVLEVMSRLRSRTTIFYSTHILEDVQRVSDHVAILRDGSLVASSPTADLLEGNGQSYELGVREPRSGVRDLLASEAWISNLSMTRSEGVTTYRFNATDETRAESALLVSVLGLGDTAITSFGKKHANLEDVFLELIEGHQS